MCIHMVCIIIITCTVSFYLNVILIHVPVVPAILFSSNRIQTHSNLSHSSIVYIVNVSNTVYANRLLNVYGDGLLY
jgi:hypothetical protein